MFSYNHSWRLEFLFSLVSHSVVEQAGMRDAQTACKENATVVIITNSDGHKWVLLSQARGRAQMKSKHLQACSQQA